MNIRSDRGLRVLQVGAAASLCLHWTAVLIPERLWGVHHLAFLPVPISLALTALMMLAVALSLHGKARKWIGDRLERWPVGPRSTAVMLVATMGTLFVNLPVAHRLLGDTGLVAAWVSSGEARRSDAVVLQILGWLYAVVADQPGGDVAAYFVAVGAILGCVYVACSFALASRCGTDATGRAFAFVMMIGVAPLLLFFGYSETYAMIITGLAVVALAIVAWDGGLLPSLLVGWIVGVATAVAHPLAAFCLVPLALATVLHVRHSRQWRPRAIAALGLGLGIAGLVFAGWLVQGSESALLPFASDAPYGVFGLGHLTDAFNGLFLMAPIQPAVVIAAVVSSGRAIGKDPVVWCLGIFALAGVVVTFIVDPALGSLDWDLMSMFSIPLGALAAVCAGRYILPAGQLPGLIIVTAVATLHIAPWILVNSDSVQAARMVEVMVQHDPHHDSERRMKLAVKFQDGGFEGAAVRQYGAALQLDDTNLGALRNLGFMLYERGDVVNALKLFGRLEVLLPEDGASALARSILRWHAGQERVAIHLVVAYLLNEPRSCRARFLCRTFSRTAAFHADRDLAAIGDKIATDDFLGVKMALAKLPGILAAPLVREFQVWLSIHGSSDYQPAPAGRIDGC